MAEPEQTQGQQRKPGWWKRKSRGKKFLWTLLGVVVPLIIIIVAATTGCGGGKQTASNATGTTAPALSTEATTATTAAPTTAALVSSTSTTAAGTTTTTAPGATTTTIQTYSDGTYSVGTDIPAGLYKSAQVGDNAYWQIASDANGQKIIVNDDVRGQCYVQVTKGQYLTLRGITIAKASAVESATVASKNITDGTYLVGTDIAAGRYEGTVTAANGYWQIQTDPNGSPSHIVANSSPAGSFYVEVTKGQYLKISGVTISQ